MFAHNRSSSNYNLAECKKGFWDKEVQITCVKALGKFPKITKIVTRRQLWIRRCIKVASGVGQTISFIIAVLIAYVFANTTAYFLMLPIAMILHFIFLHILQNQCPKCDKFAAVSPTGNRSVIGGFFLSDIKEYECKYCALRYWKREP